MNIHYTLLPQAQRKKLPADDMALGFGICRTNHIFLMDYADGAWHSPRIVPNAAFLLPPGSSCFHYGQTIFEGSKAFCHADKELYLFRYEKNIERMNHSATKLCMPTIPDALHMEAVLRLLDTERHWCPSVPQSSLYIRPFMIASSDALGAKPSQKYTFCVMLSPSGPYYTGGFSKPIRLLITKQYHRAVRGGIGTAKTGGNYAASMRATAFATAKKTDQVLYLDDTNTYVEEAGTMNHYHVLRDGTFIIPAFGDTILKSITALSILDLAAMGKIKARQETVRLDALLDGLRSGEVVEAGGLGTATVISPAGSYLLEDGIEVLVGDGKSGKHSMDLYTLYTQIQTGATPAPEGWFTQVQRF